MKAVPLLSISFPFPLSSLGPLGFHVLGDYFLEVRAVVGALIDPTEIRMFEGVLSFFSVYDRVAGLVETDCFSFDHLGVSGFLCELLVTPR